jgi:hypothetical protein
MASLAASAPAVTMDSPANAADPADLAATGTDSTFDDSEREGIAALRIRLRQFCASHADSAAHLCAEDATLWRYLVAREWVVEDAATMFEQSILFKIDKDFPRLAREYVAQDAFWARMSKRCFYAGFLPGVRNSGGGPVAVERLGLLDLKGMYNHPDVFDACIKGYCSYLENCFNGVRAAGGQKKALIIGDLTGLSMSFLWYINTFKQLASVGPDNFPEVTYLVVMVNAPAAVTAIWAAVSVFLPARTKAKVKILGTNFLDEVLPELDGGLAVLPDYLGGGANYDAFLPCAMSVEEGLAEVAALGDAPAAVTAAAGGGGEDGSEDFVF